MGQLAQLPDGQAVVDSTLLWAADARRAGRGGRPDVAVTARALADFILGQGFEAIFDEFVGSIDDHVANLSNPHATTLAQLGDVSIGSQADGDLLRWDAGLARWVAAAASSLSGINADTLDGLDSLAFLRVDGSVAMAGALNMGGQAITNVGNVDGVDVSAHAARHGTGGADAITALAASIITSGLLAAARGGTGADLSAGTGFARFASGVAALVGETGTNNVVRSTSPSLTTPSASSPTLTGAPSAAGATWGDLGAVTTCDINGGTIDGATVGASSPSTVRATTITGTSTSVSALDLAGGIYMDSANRVQLDSNETTPRCYLEGGGAGFNGVVNFNCGAFFQVVQTASFFGASAARILPASNVSGAVLAMRNAANSADKWLVDALGSVRMGGCAPPTGTIAGGVLVFGDNAGNPTPATNTAGLFAKDVAGTVELFAVDEAGTVTQLSGHVDPDHARRLGVPVADDDPFPRVGWEVNPYLGREAFHYQNPRTGKLHRVVRELAPELRRDWKADQKAARQRAAEERQEARRRRTMARAWGLPYLENMPAERPEKEQPPWLKR